MVINGNIWKYMVYDIYYIYIYYNHHSNHFPRRFSSSCQVLKVLKAWAFGRNFGRLNVMPDGHLVGQWLGKCWMKVEFREIFENFWWLGKWWNYPSFMDSPPFIHHLSTMKSSTVSSQKIDTNSVAQHRGMETSTGFLWLTGDSWWFHGG